MSLGKYTEEEATHGTDDLGAKWEDNAWSQADYYLRDNRLVLTKEALITRLKEDKFTDSDINYALESMSNHLYGVMWSEQIQINTKARNDAILNHYSRQHIVESLLLNGVSQEQVKIAIDKLEINWKENARLILESILERNKDSKTGRYLISKKYSEDSLRSGKFTDTEIKYAFDSLDIDWEKHDQELLDLYKEQAKGYGASFVWHEFGMRLGYSYEETVEVFNINRKEEAVREAYHYFRNNINYSKEGLEEFLQDSFYEDEIAHAVKVVWGSDEMKSGWVEEASG